MNSRYVLKRGRHQHDDFNVEHHYRVNIFNTAIDSQLFELNSRYSEQVMELLTLSSVLDPKDAYKSFNIDDTLLVFATKISRHNKCYAFSVKLQITDTES